MDHVMVHAWPLQVGLIYSWRSVLALSKAGLVERHHCTPLPRRWNWLGHWRRNPCRKL